MNTMQTLEFSFILEKLAGYALSDRTADRLRALEPYLNERECKRRMQETTDARRILDSLGNPPLPSMKELIPILELASKESLLLPEQLICVARFLEACKRMRSYLKRAEPLFTELSSYKDALAELSELREEIDRCIRNDRVDDAASSELRNVRRKIDNIQGEIRGKLDQLLRSKKEWFADGSAVMRDGRWVLPVKKQYRTQVGGTVVGSSGSGGTCFIEPASVSRLREEISLLEAEEENEVRRILYTLSGMVDDQQIPLRLNAEALETLDFAFAKAKLSASMKASAVPIHSGRRIRILQGRHPLLNAEECVPLDFEVGEGLNGIIITGPNTGGKTVAIKTVGLLSMMAQTGLHVPAGEGSTFCMHNAYLCDIGDGQSIEQNLSTFSSHITNIIAILQTATRDSLVLLDELGSGTDPAEGMGIAIAILEELRQKNCLFAATTHYPEVKEYAASAEGLINARMAFDRESLRPLYRLEIGEAGESCALYIAQRLGLPQHMLVRAYQEAYSKQAQPEPAQSKPATSEQTKQTKQAKTEPVRSEQTIPRQAQQVMSEQTPFHQSDDGTRLKSSSHAPKLQREAPEKAGAKCSFQIGDSVEVSPNKDVGIVYRPVDDMGMVCVQVKGVKKLYSYKRLKLLVSAESLYPPDYDFSIIFDTVDNRKARHQMNRQFRPDLVVTYENEEDWT